MRAGERFAAEFGLGDVPATRLSQSMERQLDILVLMVDAERDISGAACRLPEMDAVLIARREVAGRRHFDLAHELFHILTWDAMPPEHSEAARRRHDAWILCGPDRASLRCGVRLGFRERLVSLERFLDDVGH